MRSRLLIVAALGALLLAPVAGAHPNYRARSHRLHHLVRVLERKTRADRVHISKLRSELTTANGQISALQSTVAQLTEQRDQAVNEVTSLQAQIAAVPTQLAVAIEQVRREVYWGQGGVGYPRGQLVAQAALDYTVGHISTGAYGYLELVGQPLPAYTESANDMLSGQAGICGHATTVFATIVASFGLPTRSVQFSYNDPAPDGHIAAEVYYDGGWHFFDPTYGQFWTDLSGSVLSIDDVRNGLGSLQRDWASFTNLIEGPNDTDFETDPSTTVTIGAAPLP